MKIDELCSAHIGTVLKHLLQSKKPLTAKQIADKTNTAITPRTAQVVLDALEDSSMAEKTYSATEIGKAYFYYKAQDKETKEEIKRTYALP